jgi:hypothetical protein
MLIEPEAWAFVALAICLLLLGWWRVCRYIPPAVDPRRPFRYRMTTAFGVFGCCLWGPSLIWVVPIHEGIRLLLLPGGLLAGSIAGYIVSRLAESLIYPDLDESDEVLDDDSA